MGRYVRILQLLEVAGRPEDVNIAGLRFHGMQGNAQKTNRLPPVHPGEIIREDIGPPAGLSVTGAAKALGVSRQMLHDILAARKPLSAVMCLKLARLFGGSPEVWMRLQAAYDLKKAARKESAMRRGGAAHPYCSCTSSR